MFDVYKSTLLDRSNQVLLEENFDSTFTSFKIIIDSVYEPPKLNSNNENEKKLAPVKPWFCVPVDATIKSRYNQNTFKIFKQQTQLIVDTFKNKKPLVREFCVESLYQRQYDTYRHCAKVTERGDKSHHRVSCDCVFFDDTALVLKKTRNQPENPINILKREKMEIQKKKPWRKNVPYVLMEMGFLTIFVCFLCSSIIKVSFMKNEGPFWPIIL